MRGTVGGPPMAASTHSLRIPLAGDRVCHQVQLPAQAGALRTGANIRKALQGYTESYLTFVWTMAAAAVVLSYALWAFERDGHSGVWFEISIVPFAIAILRYAVLVDSGVAGEPEDIALHDYRLQVQAAAWLTALVVAIIWA
jgi:decaprenyl-phosphate phosphoribosyltransferase